MVKKKTKKQADSHFPDWNMSTHTRGPVIICRQLRGRFQLWSSLSVSTTGTVNNNSTSTGT